jgi:hypoxanthine phosphoribosyltransferase
MTIEHYENTLGEPMVLVIDEENDTAQSMTLAYYEELEAAKEAQSF